MIEGVSIQLASATESSVRLSLVGDGAVDLAGEWELYGPRCEYGRTLASTFRGKLAGNQRVEFFVTEPCYWSAAMPFLYELRRVDAGDSQLDKGAVHTLGLRRLIAHGPNLRLNGERIVLRGAVAAAVDEQTVREAHGAEAAIVVAVESEPCELSAASRWGATVIVDASRYEGSLEKLRLRLSWEPAAAAIVYDKLPTEPVAFDDGILNGAKLDAGNGNVPADAADAQLLLGDLANDERPPAVLATSNQPVLALRRKPAFATFSEARTACDRLQAELAPEFNLAGYFAGHVRGAK